MKIVGYYSLAKDVVAVAVVGEALDWAAYIGATSCSRHADDLGRIAAEGDKLPEKVASIIFPNIAAQYRWRA